MNHIGHYVYHWARIGPVFECTQQDELYTYAAVQDIHAGVFGLARTHNWNPPSWARNSNDEYLY